MKASDLFVKCLENEGVEYIFGIPGEENADFFRNQLELNERDLQLIRGLTMSKVSIHRYS